VAWYAAPPVERAICCRSSGFTSISTCSYSMRPKRSVPVGYGTRPPFPIKMVNTLMPRSFAICAACSGERLPALLSPSVSRMITLLFASDSRRRFTAVASALPMAVPSTITPVFTWSSSSSSTR